MYYTDDPVSDFLRYDAEQNERLSHLPVCHECGEHIQVDEAYYLHGEWVCPDCMEDYKRAVPYL